MCGRFVSVSTPEELAEHFEVGEVRTEGLGERYNVAPSLDVYSVVEHDESRRLGTLRWGFIPYWAKSLKDTPTPINARVETVHESGMFSSSFAKRRCIVPADGFYEWKEREGASKQAYFIHDPDDEPLALAALWSVWRDPSTDGDGEPVYSCAIVTTDAVGGIREIHERMPVILPRGFWADWLTVGPDEAPHLHETVSRLGAPELSARPISARVNNVRNDGPELLEPDTD